MKKTAMVVFLTLLLVGLLSAPACASQTYQVQPGDSLFWVAQRFGTSISALQQANNLQDPTMIYPGQTLTIPSDANQSSSYISRTDTASRGGFSSSDLYLMAEVVNGEARGESYVGQVAVAAVILNRLYSPNFPNTISGVIYEPGAFTCVDDGQIYAPMEQSCIQAVNDALTGWDPSGGALYYWDPARATSTWVWSRPIIGQIGNHVFAV